MTWLVYVHGLAGHDPDIVHCDSDDLLAQVQERLAARAGSNNGKFPRSNLELITYDAVKDEITAKNRSSTERGRVFLSNFGEAPGFADNDSCILIFESVNQMKIDYDEHDLKQDVKHDHKNSKHHDAKVKHT